MHNDQEETLWREVQDALKRYRRADDLERQAARSWPATEELAGRGVGVVAAIRQVLDEAIAELEGSGREAARLLREHYVRGRSIEALAADYALDPSNLHRRRNQLVDEIAVLIAGRNRRAERDARAQRFLPRQPVFGLETLAADLVARLRDPEAPAVVVLEGMGGLGKTTLARLVAGQCAADDVFAGVLWTSAAISSTVSRLSKMIRYGARLQ
jgi:hypothetical protein